MNYFNLILKPKIRMMCVLCAGLVIPSTSFAADTLSSKSASPEERMQQDIQQRVSVLRSERIEKMPYLDKSFIRAAINEKTFADKESFVGAGPQSLQSILDRAILVYLPARVAHEKEVLAKRRILVAIRNLFPEAGVEMQQQEGNLSGSPFNQKSYRVILKQPVFRGGILWNSVLKEKATLKQNARERDQIISDLVQEVSQAYFEYQRTLLVTEERKGVLDEVNKYGAISLKKWDAKIISEIEYLNVQSLVSQLEYDYQSAIQELELARLELQKFVELDSEDDLDIVRLYDMKSILQPPAAGIKSASGKDGKQKKVALKDIPMRSPVTEIKIQKPEALLDIAYQNRPELQMAAARLRAARLEEKIQWGATLPEVNVIINTGKDAQSFNPLFDEFGNNTNGGTFNPSWRMQYSIGMEFKWNLAGNTTEYTFTNEQRPPSVSTFQGGSGSQTTTNLWKMNLLDGLDVFANTKSAEIDKLEQVVELDKAEKEVIKSVKEAYYDFQRASIQLKSGIQRLTYRERLLRLSKHRLGKNEVEISEYLQAVQEFLNQKVEVHKTLADYYAAKAKLNRAVGRRDFLPLDVVNL